MTKIARNLRTLVNREEGISWPEVLVVTAIGLIIALLAVESTWLFFAQRNVSDAAQAGTEVAAANLGTTNQLGQTICKEIDVNHPTTGPTITLTPSGLTGAKGDTATVTVSTPIRSFSGILTPLFRRITMSSTKSFELERPEEGVALWWNDGEPSSYRCR